MKHILLLLLFMMVTPPISGHKGTPYTDSIKARSASEISGLTLPVMPVKRFDSLVSYGIALLANKQKSDSVLKGRVILLVAANKLNSLVASKSVDFYSADVSELVFKLKKYNMIIAPPPMSAFLKIANHLCESDYWFLIIRFEGSGFFVPTIILIAILASLIVVCYLKTGSPRLKKLIRRILAAGFIFLVIISLAFRLTCHKYVNQTSFYGFRV